MDSDEDLAYEDENTADSSSNELEDGFEGVSADPPLGHHGKGIGLEDDSDEMMVDQNSSTHSLPAKRERTISTSSGGMSVDYSFLAPEQICQYMNQFIKEVQQIIQLPLTTTRILLSHFKWDKEVLMEKYYEDSDKLFKDASVISPDSMKPLRGSVSSGVCDICMATLKGSELKGTDCGHRFCANCWRSYFMNKIVDENSCVRIECPAYQCHILVGKDDFVMEMLSGSGPAAVAVRRKYQRGITNSFVEAHKCMRWCAGINCAYAVRVSSSDWIKVECTHCKTSFCFLCGEPWHDPVLCDVLRRWKKKCADDSETSNWISANTKDCPTCHATIEKDGGCNHVVCKNTACKAEFCWICLGPWQPHGSSWFKCNRYSDEDAKSARDAQERSRAALQRYLFYFNRFMNHKQSLLLESKLKTSIHTKMEEMQQHNMTWIEVQFLSKAVETLQNCRQTLLYTYVFAFYLDQSNQQIIFEENQNDLQNATEVLSGFLERDITGQNVSEIRQKVQDKACYCEMRRKALVEHVHEGYDQDWWHFNK